jgi:hypothetical protein
VIRFYNNEVIYKQMSATHNVGWFMDLEEFGNSGGRGLGEVWVYGNIFRMDPSFVNKLQWFFPTSCSEDVSNETASWRFYYFNNTWDGWSSGGSTSMQGLCSQSGSANHDGELYVGKNNVEVWTTNEQATDTAATLKISNNLADDPSKCSGASRYFACGTGPTTQSGLAYYAPWADGGLRRAGTCDPDGNGVAGVDYNGDGTNDTSWRDIAGNLVSCPTLTSTIDVGAIQSSGTPPNNDPPATVNGLRRTDKPHP